MFKAGRAPHVNNVELGRNGRDRSNVWDYAGANSLRGAVEDATRAETLALHPTVKPVALLADAILNRENTIPDKIIVQAVHYILKITRAPGTIVPATRRARRTCTPQI